MIDRAISREFTGLVQPDVPAGAVSQADVGDAAPSLAQRGRQNRAAKSPVFSHSVGTEFISGLVGLCAPAVSPLPPHQSLTVDLGYRKVCDWRTSVAM